MSYNQSVVGYFTDGLARLQLDQYKECIEDFDKVINLSKDNELKTNAYYNRGFAKAMLHEYQEAIEDFNTAIDLSEDHDLKILCCGGRAMANYAMKNQTKLKESKDEC